MIKSVAADYQLDLMKYEAVDRATAMISLHSLLVQKLNCLLYTSDAADD